MPRTRRTAPQAAATESAPTPEAAAELVSPAPSPGPAPVSTPPRRGRRKPATDVAAEVPAVSSETPPDVPVQKRGGRRKAAIAVTAEPPADREAPSAQTSPPQIVGSQDVLPDLEAATEDVTPPAQRRRRRSAISTAVPDVEATVSAETSDLEDSPPARRRGRRRVSPSVSPETTSTSAETVPEAAPAPSEASTPSQRRRGRRTTASSGDIPAAVAPESTETSPPPSEPPATETAAAANAPPPLRRRGRRRAGAETVPTSDEPPIDLVAPVTGDDAETNAAEEGTEESRRGRRGRRSRRRRADILEPIIEEGEESLLVGPEPVSVTDAEEEEAAAPLPPPAVPTFVAPPLVPPVQTPADGALLPRSVARLEHGQSGLAKIVVNDVPHPPYVFFVNAEEAVDGAVVDRELAGAASAGVHLYSGVLYLPFQNAYGNRSFGAADAFVQQVLTADPDAYIIPRIQCVPTNFWARTHEDQMAAYADGTKGDVSLASSAFWADCIDALEALISHFADPATTGGDRVIGFHLDRGEWFYDVEAGYDLSAVNREAFGNWLHAKYQQPYRLRAAWVQNSADFEGAAPPAWTPPPTKYDPSPLYSAPREGRWPDYHLFASELVAQAITGLAEAIKVLSDGRMLVGVSYGYTLEFAHRPDSGHLALARVLESPHVDILAGPNSYTGRGAGSPAAFGAPVDSIALHGKLWLVEDDTKTFLADAETPDAYNPKIVGGADTQAAHQRTFGAALAHNAGVAWMDLWGQGWLDSSDIWAELGGLTRQAARWEQLGGSKTQDVAVFVDEESLAYIKGGAAGLGQILVGKTREILIKSGASVGFYLQSDVLRNSVPDAKLYLFLNALRLTSQERAAIQEKLQVAGKTLAWLYAPGVFDENGLSETEASDAVGMSLRPQPWNSRGGSQLTDVKHPLTERLRAARRGLGTDDVLNPSYMAVDSEATVLAEYAQGGGASLAVCEHTGGWKSVFVGDPHLSPELLRGLYAYAGVPVADVQDDVTHVTNGVLLVHAAFTGQRTLSLPRPATIYDVTEDRIIATGVRSFRSFLRARTTRLFLWGDADKVMEATGLPLPDMASLEPEMPEPAAPALSSEQSPDKEDTAVEFTVVALDEEIVALDLDAETAVVTEKDEDDEDTEAFSDFPAGEEGMAENATSSRRSRWQRRRAALRARRETERNARLAAEGNPNLPGTPADVASLLSDLPPRRLPESLPDGGGEDAE